MGARPTIAPADRASAEPARDPVAPDSADAISLYREASRRCRDLGLPLDEGLTAIEMATLLDPADPVVRTAIDAGRAVLVGLGARPFVEQLDAALAPGVAGTPA